MSDKELEHSVGKTIATLRKEKAWTQVELAKKLGVSDKAVSKWESEAGFPEISQLPALANIFGVTIDYIMTGKMPEEKIVTISAMELCAKNDDPSMLSQISNLSGKDEKGQTFFQLIIKYQSARVFNKLLSEDKQYQIIDSSMRRTGAFNRYVRQIVHLCIISNNANKLNRFGFLDIGVANREEWSDEAIIALLTDDRVTDDTFYYVFNMHKRNQVDKNGRPIINNWQIMYPEFFDYAVKNNIEDKIERIISILEQIADNAESQIMADKKAKITLDTIINRKIYNPVIYATSINLDTMHYLLSTHNYELLNRCIALNKKVGGRIPTDKEIELEKMRENKSSSKEEIFVYSCLDNGILIIDDLIKSSNSSLIIDTINKYPIHYIEILYKWWKEENWKAIFEFAVDNNMSTIELLNNDKNAAMAEFLNTLWVRPNDNSTIKPIAIQNKNKKYTDLCDRTRVKFSYAYDLENNNDICKLYENAIAYLDAKKTEFVNKIKIKTALENITHDLTKEFFIEQLNNGAIETVIIKLCVRLEAFLKKQYNDYESDFFVLLNKYCGEAFEILDDESNLYDPYTPMLLQKLRMHRNSIVHPEESAQPLTPDELKHCIEYICN